MAQSSEEYSEQAKRLANVCPLYKTPPLSAILLLISFLFQIQMQIRTDTFAPPTCPSDGCGNGNYCGPTILDPVIPKDIYSPSRMDVLGMLVSAN
jgi:hypothetical protein